MAKRKGLGGVAVAFGGQVGSPDALLRQGISAAEAIRRRNERAARVGQAVQRAVTKVQRLETARRKKEMSPLAKAGQKVSWAPKAKAVSKEEAAGMLREYATAKQTVGRANLSALAKKAAQRALRKKFPWAFK